MQKECRKAHKSNMDKMLFDPFVDGKKKIFSIILNPCVEITMVIPRYRKMVLATYSRDEDKAEVLNRCFSVH